MTRFIKADVMSKATSVTKLMSIDVNDRKNHLHYSNIDIGFTTERLISQLTSGSRRTISEKAELEFRMEAKECLQTLVCKFMVKSPLQYTLVRNMSCLDPHLLVSDQDL